MLSQLIARSSSALRLKACAPVLAQAKALELQQRLDDSEAQCNGTAVDLAKARCEQSRLQGQLASSQQENSALRNEVCLPGRGAPALPALAQLRRSVA